MHGITRDGHPVRLEPLRPDHIPAVAAAVADPAGLEMLRHWINLAGPAREREEVLAATLTPPEYLPFTVLAGDADGSGTHRVVGVRWLEPDGSGNWSCGGWVTHSWRRRGVGSLALTLALQWASRHGARSVTTATRQDNVAAQTNLAACGFVPAGLARNPGHPSGVETLEVWTVTFTAEVTAADVA